MKTNIKADVSKQYKTKKTSICAHATADSPLPSPSLLLTFFIRKFMHFFPYRQAKYSPSQNLQQPEMRFHMQLQPSSAYRLLAECGLHDI